jgi:hypothetical protein
MHDWDVVDEELEQENAVGRSLMEAQQECPKGTGPLGNVREWLCGKES